MANPKEMLSTIIRTGTLSAREREAFEGMWDQWHRCRKLSNKQRAWVESVYYKQKMDKVGSRPPPKRSPKVGFIRDPKATVIKRASSMEQFKGVCPDVEPGSPLYKRVDEFFSSGGQIFEVRPSPFPER
jgi:hypothetical protein